MMNPSTRTSVDELGSRAADIAMRAAIAYLGSRGELDALTANETAMEHLCGCIRQHAKARISEALRDAREALDVHMPEAAELTFFASMSLAGVEGAKCYLEEK